MNQRIDFLIHKHLNQTLTREEVIELGNLINSGTHESEIKNLIGEDLLLQFQGEACEQDISHLGNMFSQIVSPFGGQEATILPLWQRLKVWSVAAAILVGLSWYFFANELPSELNITAKPRPVLQAISESEQKFIKLPDGSKVQLNKNSELTYDSMFTTNREVTLRGEAFFDVAPDHAHPFRIHTGKIVTTVLGTAFNIRTSEKNVIVSVTRGLVQVGDDKRVYAKIRPREKIMVATETLAFAKEPASIETDLSWKSGTLVIDELTMQQTADTLQKLFHKKITIENPQIAQCRISGTFLNNESLDEILTLVCGARQATFTIRGQEVIIGGGLPCRP